MIDMFVSPCGSRPDVGILCCLSGGSFAANTTTLHLVAAHASDPRCCVRRPDCGRGWRGLWMERAVRISEASLRFVDPSSQVREDAHKHWGLRLTYGHI